MMRINTTDAAEIVPGHAGVELIQGQLVFAFENTNVTQSGGAHDGTATPTE